MYTIVKGRLVPEDMEQKIGCWRARVHSGKEGEAGSRITRLQHCCSYRGQLSSSISGNAGSL